ncbi:hypothetical protein M0804_006836 [Polistes exclamans]|nr:hypothetical protein M0804_006836 [Polistes exclamans]
MLTDMTPAAAGQLYPQLQSIAKSPAHGHVGSQSYFTSRLEFDNWQMFYDVTTWLPLFLKRFTLGKPFLARGKELSSFVVVGGGGGGGGGGETRR